MKTTALEMLSEPLSLLVLLAALTLTTLAPAFHYHQFGEATRMARDAGFSALFTCGLVVSVFGIIRSLRREIETGTIQMALSHPISRTGFFLAKTVGGGIAVLLFSVVVTATSLTIVNGAAIGGALAQHCGDIPKIWGPSLAIGVGTMVMPLLLGAVLNRFARCRFVLTAFSFAFVISVAGVFYRPDFALMGRILPVAVLILLTFPVFLAAAAAAATRFRANGAAATAGVLFVLVLPVVGNYYLSDALARGGTLPWRYVCLAAGVTAPAVAAFLLWGIHLINGRDVA